LADQRGLGRLLTLFAAESALVGAALAVLRTAGIRLVDVTEAGRPPAESADHGRFQFQLGDLLSCTVTLVLLLSLVQFVRGTGIVWPDSQGLADLVPFAAGVAMTAVAAAWTALAARRAGFGWLAMVSGVLIAARAFPGVGGGFTLAVLFSALVLGPLAVFRVCGYRLVRSAPIHRGQTARETA